MTKEEILKQVAALKAESQELWNDIDEHSKEEERVAGVLHNAESIMDKLDSTFEKRTALTAADTTILMIATALQVMRIYLLSKFQEKIKDEDRLAHNDSSIKEKVKEQMQKYKEEHSNWKSKKSQKGYRSWQEIAFTIKIPYDATRHSGEGFHNRSMHGGQHRVKTLGHDPILGWLFGVSNIITDSITICPKYKLGEKNSEFHILSHIMLIWALTFAGKSRLPLGLFFLGVLKVLKKTNIDYMQLYLLKECTLHQINIPRWGCRFLS